MEKEKCSSRDAGLVEGHSITGVKEKIDACMGFLQQKQTTDCICLKRSHNEASQSKLRTRQKGDYFRLEKTKEDLRFKDARGERQEMDAFNMAAAWKLGSQDGLIHACCMARLLRVKMVIAA